VKALKIIATIIVGFPVAIVVAAVLNVIVVVGLTAEAVAWVAGRPSTHCPGHEGFGGSA
jgi:hypothetical protein